MFHVLKGVVVVVALSLMAAWGWAEEVPIFNPGFTMGFTIGWEPIEFSGSGDNFSGSNVVVSAGWFPAPANAALSDEKSVILFGSNAAFRQELGAFFQSNMKYTLQFDVGAPDRDPDAFRSVTDYHVGLWRGGTVGVWESGVEMFDANGETYGYVSTTAGAGGVWKHVTAEWITGDLSQEILDSFIQVRVGEAGPYAVFDNIQLDVEPAPEGVDGDYNNDGVVDAADYVAWRRGGPLLNEVADPGTVSPADYDEWRARFGNTSGSGSSLAAKAIVPEPSAIVLLLLGLVTAFAHRSVPPR